MQGEISKEQKSEAPRESKTRVETKKTLFIFGVSGFTGKRLAKHCSEKLRAEFTEISGTTRQLSSPQPSGYTEYLLLEDGSLPQEAINALERATHVLSTVPTNSDNTLENGIIEAKAKRGTLEWAGYLSTTATYGDRGGSSASEEDVIDPSVLSERGLARLRVEENWRKTGAPIHIFRLPGIYGPGRGPLAKAREPSNRLILKENQVFCRVHVDDIVQALVLSMRKPNPGRVYNVSDNEPAPSHEASLFAYQLLNKTPPPLVRYEDIEKDLSPMVKSFYSECKRVNSDRAKLELGYFPEYPTYREGFVAQVKEEGDDFKAVPISSSSQGAITKRPKASQAVTSEPLRTPLTSLVVRILAFFSRFFQSSARTASNLYQKLRFYWLAKFYQCAVILIDNGSVRPGATLGMRRLSQKLQTTIYGIPVTATSWRYADRIDSKVHLNGEKAVMFPKAIEDEKSKFVVILPMFLGPSTIVTKEIPKLLNRSTQKIATPFVEVESPENCVITNILSRSAFAMLDGRPCSASTKFLLIDHGSPNRDVNRVRRALAARLRAKLYPAVVVDCSMERRPEPEYDFNEPTLENAFELGGFDRGEVFVIPAFLFPGNHAGPGGDIETIITDTLKVKPYLTVKLGKLLMDESNDDIVVDLLERRVRQALL